MAIKEKILTNGRTRLEVMAEGIDGLRVDCGELVGRDVLCAGNAITDISIADSVRACASGISSQYRYKKRREEMLASQLRE
jgi:hypothetical protein